MYDFSDFYQLLAQDAKLQPWLMDLPTALHHWQQQPNGDLPKWLKVLNKIPQPVQAEVELTHEVNIGDAASLPAGERAKLENLLRTFHPWRKGPYQVHGVHIDTEWRSDWKWDRVLPHISPLKNRYVLDVGCGNGYHMWRMLGQGAALTVGVDPCELFLVQFAAMRKLMGGHRQAHLLPLGIEALPKSNAFDTVFSMGVLYHRRSPLDHLLQLKDQLAPNGELVLETLVVDGDEQTVLVPVDRYAQMRNVYFFPSAKALKVWLEKCGFVDVRIVDESVTTTDEQRSTGWMTHQSLPDYLDKSDPSRTIEGYNAPKRAILIAKNSD